MELRPAWPLRLPPTGRDGILRRAGGGVLERLVHPGGVPAVVRALLLGDGRLVLQASAATPGAAEAAVARLRWSLGADEDLRAFHAAHRDDPLIGPSLTVAPWLRPQRRAEPWEALAWAVCEQLITLDEAICIQRRLIARHGRRHGHLRDVPTPEALAALAPAELEACGLAGRRALALRRVATEVAAGRVDLHAEPHEPGWRRLRAIASIGSWTVACLATHGQGRHDLLPAGDLAYRKLVGGLLSGGDPRARATEAEVDAWFAPYAPWAALAGPHALRAGADARRAVSPGSRRPRGPRPPRAGTPSSGPRRSPAA